MLAADKGWASTNAIPQPVGVADAAGESDRAAAKANNGGTTMGAIDPARVATHSFDWGVIKWMVSPDQTPGAKITFGEVVLLPGQGHVRDNHPFRRKSSMSYQGSASRWLTTSRRSWRIPATQSISPRQYSIRPSTRAGSRSAYWRSIIPAGPNAR